MLTEEQPYLLRRSFARVERQAHVSALVFYQQLFELDPSLRPLFKNDIENQAAKLMEMLAASLSLLEKPQELVATLEELGARHVGYGVETSHYATVGLALIAMLQRVLGPDFTPETRQAWSDLYQIITETMLRGAARVHP